MADLKTYTLKDPTVEAWQWNGPGDCPGVVETGYGVLRCRRCAEESEMTKHGEILIAGELVFVCQDAWIIKCGDTYEVMPDVEFRAKYDEVPKEYQPDVTEILQVIVDQLPECEHNPNGPATPCPICDAREILAWPESEEKVK